MKSLLHRRSPYVRRPTPFVSRAEIRFPELLPQKLHVRIRTFLHVFELRRTRQPNLTSRDIGEFLPPTHRCPQCANIADVRPEFFEYLPGNPDRVADFGAALSWGMDGVHDGLQLLKGLWDGEAKFRVGFEREGFTGHDGRV